MILRSILLISYILNINGLFINPLFNNWNCIGIKENIDFSKTYKYNIGELPLVFWKNTNTSLVSTINICKHMGSSLDNGKIEKSCLVCPYHGLKYDEYSKIGHTIEHEGKIYWSYKPLNKKPYSVPFYNNKKFEKSFIQIDMDCSFQDSAYNTMDLHHPEYVHSGIVGFGNNIPPTNIKDHYYNYCNMIGLSFDYKSNDIIKKLNKNAVSTENYHMFNYPSFSWSKVTFNKKNHLIIGVDLLPLEEKKTRWIITIVHNYMNNNIIEKNFMKSMAYTILLQDYHQLKNQYKENSLKKEVIFNYHLSNENPIIRLKELFNNNYIYPNIDSCVNLYKDFN